VQKNYQALFFLWTQCIYKKHLLYILSSKCLCIVYIAVRNEYSMIRSLHARKDYQMCTMTKICGWMGIRHNSTTQSGSFAKYSDVGLVKISFPVCCVLVLRRATGLPTGMSHRAACGWSQVALTPALWPCAALWPCTFCSDPAVAHNGTTVPLCAKTGTKPVLMTLTNARGRQ